MIALLFLIGLGASVAVINSAPNDEDDPTVTSAELGDENDLVVSSDFLDELQTEADILVAEGELTQAEADQSVAAAVLLNGPFSVETNGGDDAVIGSNLTDTILAGDGDDQVQGRDGDDLVELGDGSDASGVDTRAGAFPDDIRPFTIQAPGESPDLSEAEFEAGNDTIFGGSGDDDIADGFGSNLLAGNRGSDILIGVDQDDVSPDTLEGGLGSDAIIVDEGDAVSPGPQSDNAIDRVTVDVFAGVESGYDPVTIEDFDPVRDVIELEGSSGLLLEPSPTPENPDPADPVSVAQDGEDTLILINDIPVVRVLGVQDISRSDLRVST